MQVGLSDEHELLVTMVDAVAAQLAPSGVEGFGGEVSEEGWTSVAELGLLGLHLPEDVGGGGAGAFEAALVVERLARGLCTLPVTGAMLAADALVATGRLDLAAQVSAGELRLAVGLTADLVSGGDAVAFDAAGAAQAVVPGPGGVALAGVGARFDRFADLSRRAAHIVVHDHGAAGGWSAEAADRWLALALSLVSADALGVASAALEEAARYVSERRQFGVPVGSFQAVQHLAAEGHVHVEAMRSVVWHAAWSVDHRPPADALVVARHAKALTAELARSVCETAIQLLGGIAMTWEHLAHVRLRRVLADRLVLGDEQHHHAALAASPLIPPTQGLAGDTTPDYRDDVDEGAFRAELRTWLATNTPSGPLPTDPDEWAEATHRWHQALGAAGYVGLSFPAEVGGRGLPDTYEAILNDELARVGAPPAPALSHITNAIRLFGTPEQRSEHLPDMLSCRVRWCQGFSEPDAGSDLASVATRAELDGDHYVVSGQKVWTSEAIWSDWCLVLCRTGPEPRHRGLSMLLVPLDTPGIDCRPIVTAFRTEEFAEVFFDDVRVPVANLLGEPGQGWQIAMALLAYERGPADMGWIGRMGRTVHALAAETADAAEPERARVARAVSWLHALETKVARTLSDRVRGCGGDADGSVDKLLMTEVDQLVHTLWLDLHGAPGLLDEGEEMVRYLWARAAGIFGGTQQIQRNIVAQRLLGLPR